MSIGAIRDERSAEFFDALSDGRLLIRRCLPHGHPSSPEVMFCAECGSRALGWTVTQGTGTVVTWTAIHGRPDETGATTVTAYVGLVELTEGPWLLARLLVDDPAQLRIGVPVSLHVLAADGEPIYAFQV